MVSVSVDVEEETSFVELLADIDAVLAALEQRH